MTRKMGKVIVAELKKRSIKGLDLAKKILKAEEIEHPKLREAFEHYLAIWDDFTHPGLFSVACEAVGGDVESIVPVQAAIALMAAAFDIHDDIIDNSKTKNNRPTVYGKFGPELTLLLGNAFLIEGYNIFAESTKTLSRAQERGALEILKKLLFEIGNAHALELGMKKRENLALGDYMKITEMKAAGLEVDMRFGALFGKGSKAEVKILGKIGRMLGILATLRSDLIDIFDIEELRQRISVQDLPFPLLLAMQEQENETKISNIIGKDSITKEDVAELVDFALETKPIIEIKEKMSLLIEEGFSLAVQLPKPNLRNKLQAFFMFMLEDL